MEEDSNSKSSTTDMKEESTVIEPALTLDIGDVEAFGDQSVNDGAPRTPTSANRISISELIRTLTQPTVGLFPQGVAPKDLFDFMCKLPEDQRASKSRNHLQVLLWRDVKLAKICRVGVGVYTVPEFLEQIMAQHQTKGGQQSNSTTTTTTSMSSSTCQVTDNVTAMNNAIVSTTSRSSPPSTTTMTKEEQDLMAWQIINDTIVQSSQLVEKTLSGKRKKPKKDCKVENRENTPQISPREDSNEKSDNGTVSSTTPTVDGSETRPKRKRAKKNISADLSTSLEEFGSICFFCKMPGSQNIFGQSESFISCKDCQFKAHPSCLGYDKQLTEKCRKYPWQCFDCKQCSCCSTAENADSMLMCDSCDRGYHMHCHKPIIKEKPLQSDKWICSECLKETQRRLSNGTPQKNNKKNKNLPTNALIVDGNKRQIEINNTVESICGKESATVYAQLDKFTLPVIDDNPLIKSAANEAKVWTVDQVFNFISQLGFPEQATAFKREEIDGQALLLLKRNDVLSMLSLKLGPALKIHRRLSVLQSLVGENEPEDQ